jgi:hypothetical protein
MHVMGMKKGESNPLIYYVSYGKTGPFNIISHNIVLYKKVSMMLNEDLL